MSRGAENAPGTDARPLVTVAIITYNGRHLLDTVLESLRTQTFEDYRALVVDNASRDGTPEWLREHWPAVQVIVHPRNLGVAASLNTCLRAAKGEYVLLLNNDVELEPRCMEELVAALSAHPEAGVVGAKLLDFSRRELLDGTGDVYSWAGFAYRRGQGEFDHGQYDARREVFGACGAAAMYRRSAFEAVGPFDEQYFAYGEDVDWAFRAQLAGYGARYVPSAVAYHIGSASLGPRVSEFTLYQNWRNQIWVVAKNYPASALVRHAPDLILGQLAALLVAMHQRCLGEWLRAWRDALAGLPAVLRKRRQVQSSRQRGRRELEPTIEGVLARARWWLLGGGRRHSVAAARRRADQLRRPMP
jgi:GT2 family glycosyltransferase